jgi:hypothetical protein
MPDRIAKKFARDRKAALQIEDAQKRREVLEAIAADEDKWLGPNDNIEGKRARYMDDIRAS